MTRTLLIQERISKGLPKEDILEELGWEILGYMKGLEVPELDLDTEGGWVKVSVSGPDEGIAENLIIKTYGKLPSIHEVKIGDTFKGFLTDVGKVGFGVYFKAFKEEKDALYPLFEMRNQLAKGMRLPARKIARAYGFVDDLALELRVLRKDESGVYVSLSPKQVAMVRGWMNRGRDVLFIVRATPKQVRRALTRTGHKRDVSVVRTSFLSHALVCKLGTQAKGLIPRLGPHLPGAVLSTLSPARVEDLLRSSEV